MRETIQSNKRENVLPYIGSTQVSCESGQPSSLNGSRAEQKITEKQDRVSTTGRQQNKIVIGMGKCFSSAAPDKSASRGRGWSAGVNNKIMKFVKVPVSL